MSPSTIHSTRKIYKIAAIPGDGIGVEVTEAAIQVLNKLAEVSGKFEFDFTTFGWSSKKYLEKGYYIPPDGIAQLKKFDAVFFGAVGWPGRLLSSHYILNETSDTITCIW
jgi:isocitrate/isopropylmalate dehydrogenase